MGAPADSVRYDLLNKGIVISGYGLVAGTKVEYAGLPESLSSAFPRPGSKSFRFSGPHGPYEPGWERLSIERKV